MKEPDFPAVTITTVNFNGMRFLPGLFNSIKNLNYPHDKIHTIMVDNGSTDSSCELVKNQFDWVEIIKTDKNLGYAGGNNAGMRATQSEYLALINNDCIVEKNWLVELVRTAQRFEKKQKVGSVSSKVLFFFNYVPFEFRLESGKAEISGLRIRPLISLADRAPYFFSEKDLIKSLKLLEGCNCMAQESETSGLNWLIKEYALIGFPVPDMTENTEISFEIKPIPDDVSLKVTLKNKGTEKNHTENSKDIPGELFSSLIRKEGMHVKMIIGKDQYRYADNIINSCGLEVNRSFYARDRGSSLFDLGQFEKAEEIFCPSGSSLLVKKEMLDEVGYFDEDFFTYYEDIDLFWRSRLNGWKSFYAPFSVARHLHCGTGTEWSYSFTYHVLRNRIIAIFKNGWPGLVLKSYFAFIFSAVINTLFYILAVARGKKQQRPDIKARFIIFFELFYLFAKKLVLRIRIRKNRKVKDSEIKKLLVDF